MHGDMAYVQALTQRRCTVCTVILLKLIYYTGTGSWLIFHYHIYSSSASFVSRLSNKTFGFAALRLGKVYRDILEC